MNQLASEQREEVEILSWEQFKTAFDWRQGQHVTVVGANGCGKTVLVRRLLPLKKHVTVLVTKPKDPSISVLKEDGFVTLRKWPPGYNQNRVLLWPRIDKRSQKYEQRDTFVYALNSMYEQGGWCIYSDETFYLTKSLGLAPIFQDLWTQGRSIGLSIVASLQRPSHVPLLAYTEATHLFFFRFTDVRDIKRIAGIGSLNAATIQNIITRLAGPVSAGATPGNSNQFLYVNVRSGRLIVSRVDIGATI